MPLPVAATPENLRYLITKRDRLGHQIDGLPAPMAAEAARDGQAAQAALGEQAAQAALGGQASRARAVEEG